MAGLGSRTTARRPPLTSEQLVDAKWETLDPPPSQRELAETALFWFDLARQYELMLRARGVAV